MILIGCLGYQTSVKSGFELRNISALNKDSSSSSKTNPEDNANFGSGNKVLDSMIHAYPAQDSKGVIVLWGDSFADSWSAVFQEIGMEKGYSIVTISSAGCPPLIGAKKYNPPFQALRVYCGDDSYQSNAVEYIKQLKPKKIIYLGSWAGYSPARNISFTTDSLAKEDAHTTHKTFREKLPLTISKLAEITDVVVFKDWPLLLRPLRYGVNRQLHLNIEDSQSAVSYKDHLITEEFINSLFEGIRNSRVQFFDPAIKLCVSDICALRINNERLYLNDGHHPSKYATFLYKDDIINVLGI
jgi:hypothetical protein